MDMATHNTINSSVVIAFVMAFENDTRDTEAEVSMINERHERLQATDIGDLLEDVSLV